MIEAGTVQNGLKLISTIFEVSSGDLPVGFSNACDMARGDAPILHGFDLRAGNVDEHAARRRRARDRAQAHEMTCSCRTRAAAEIFMSSMVDAPTFPVGVSPCRA